jgi:hypothetical protein
MQYRKFRKMLYNNIKLLKKVTDGRWPRYKTYNVRVFDGQKRKSFFIFKAEYQKRFFGNLIKASKIENLDNNLVSILNTFFTSTYFTAIDR